MRTWKKKSVKVVDDVRCDCCGQSCTKEVPTIKPSFDHEYATIEATWGYFSNHDGSQYNIDLCENCFFQVLEFIKNKRKEVLGPFQFPYSNDPLDGQTYI
jgi:hypothetical protein